ncbi:MAG: adenosylcobinamide-phosphate synthase CbiB [Desulfobulbaceae bacterium]|jgi:adenosylcobinamide-phosphate synthase|nr:adenosylcobinamide-phosphate synthase CbiB [Desulfobulbaceae bacterium]
MVTAHLLHILLALVLDQLLGDPRWFPHPVRLIGWLQLRLEVLTRRYLDAKPAGFITVVLALSCVLIVTMSLLLFALFLHPVAYHITSVFLLYTCFATRDLARHGRWVHQALVQDDLPLARIRVGWIVGRDTAHLNTAGVARAGVESVAESLVDGVTAPLFYALLGGPLGAMLYKAINTGDSMFGYKNEEYLHFGWAAAKLDDVVNYIPARLTAWMIPVSAYILGLDYKESVRILRRDCRNHASPNAGYSEAAVAGALGVQLGGNSSYFGKVMLKPTIGDERQPVDPTHLVQSIRIMELTTLLMFGVGCGLVLAAVG